VNESRQLTFNESQGSSESDGPPDEESSLLEEDEWRWNRFFFRRIEKNMTRGLYDGSSDVKKWTRYTVVESTLTLTPCDVGNMISLEAVNWRNFFARPLPAQGGFLKPYTAGTGK